MEPREETDRWFSLGFLVETNTCKKKCKKRTIYHGHHFRHFQSVIGWFPCYEPVMRQNSIVRSDICLRRTFKPRDMARR